MKLIKIKCEHLLQIIKNKIPNAFVHDELNIYHEDVLNMEAISIHNPFVKDVSEIKYFLNLKQLSLHNTYVKNLNLDFNVNIESINLVYNNLHTINISKCIKLNQLNIAMEENLKKIYLNDNTNLIKVNFADVDYDVLDISHNKKLQSIKLWFCKSNVIFNKQFKLINAVSMR